MALCKYCGEELAEGSLLCKNCKKLNMEDTSDESYLDSLLSSVTQVSDDEGADKDNAPAEYDVLDEFVPTVDFSTIETVVPEQVELTENISDKSAEAEDGEKAIIIDDLALDAEVSVDDSFDFEVGVPGISEETEDVAEPEIDISDVQEASETSETSIDDLMADFAVEDFAVEDFAVEDVQPSEEVTEELTPVEIAGEPSEETVTEEIPEGDLVNVDDLESILGGDDKAMLDDLLSTDDLFAQPEDTSELEMGDLSDLFGGDGAKPADNISSTEELGDIADLFGPSDPVTDILPEGDVTDSTEELSEGVSDISDASELFGGIPDSEALDLSGLTGWSDMNTAEGDFAELFGADFLSEHEDDINSPHKKQGTDEKFESGVVDTYDVIDELFANKEIDPSKIKPEPTPEEIEAEKAAKLEEKKAKEAEAKAIKEEAKAEKERIKQEKAQIELMVKEEKKAKKLEKARLAAEEAKNTRINPAGAAIVFIMFALLAVVLIFGSNIFFYNVSISNAQKNFDRKNYNEAYFDIYGLDIKAKDGPLFDKIVTVMYINKELNSYNNYAALGEKNKALDSLIKGLERYDKYYDLARRLDIQTDLDYVRTQILAELSSVYGISEQKAMELTQMTDSVEYSLQIDEISAKRLK